MPELQEEEDFYDEEVEPIMLTDGNISTTPAAVIDLAALFEGPIIDFDVVKTVLKAIDLVTVVYFCIEYIVRFVCSPDKKKFFFQVRSSLV